ncbi:hypothetical protein AVEN_134072-1 [Araneus ventricosus]|uniref:Uncharacterized protein n=1 Tax=Araneus ventricosus TaxID=182803 RepID=A0A4Y2INT8_ARAVE|nr:hypothetical protein AVEN_134072-1 [Araneus ventricosus]
MVGSQSLLMEPFDDLGMVLPTNNAPDDEKAPTLTTMLSAKTYALRNLVEPEKPKAEPSGRGECGEVLRPVEKINSELVSSDSFSTKVYETDLRSGGIENKLLSEADLIYEKEVSIAMAMRTAARDADELHTTNILQLCISHLRYQQTFNKI